MEFYTKGLIIRLEEWAGAINRSYLFTERSVDLRLCRLLDTRAGYAYVLHILNHEVWTKPDQKYFELTLRLHRGHN